MIQLIDVTAIDALLPQTQCGKCGHPGCRPYAEGIAAGEAINKCPPGGDATVQALAKLLNVAPLPLELPEVPAQVAFIREAECIGCTKCIQACPVDAIVGAAKLMHTVIKDQCTGCDLCVAPCPVDCIDMLPLSHTEASAQRAQADQFRLRHQAHQARLASQQAERQAQRSARHIAPTTDTQTSHSVNEDSYKRLKMEAAMAKVVLAKAQKQFAQHATEALKQQVELLQRAAEQAQQALATAAPAPSAPAVQGVAALNQAKIQLAMRRAELAKAQRQDADELTLEPLRQALTAAEQALHTAEANCAKPAPDLQRIDKQPVDTQLRELKTELAFARAELQKLQRRHTANPAVVSHAALEQAQQRLAAAEQRLNAYQTR